MHNEVSPLLSQEFTAFLVVASIILGASLAMLLLRPDPEE